MRILFDLDDTLADWGSGYDKWLNEQGCTMRVDDACYIPRFSNLKEYDLFSGRTENEIKLVNDLMNSEHFYRDLEPIEGAIDAVYKLQELGHEIWLVSTPWPSNPTCASDKYNWVAQHLGQEWTKRLILTFDKTIIPGDILIDDKPLIKGANENPSWKHVIFAQPHNAKYRSGKRVIHNWTDGEWLERLTHQKRWPTVKWDESYAQPVPAPIAHQTILEQVNKEGAFPEGGTTAKPRTQFGEVGKSTLFQMPTTRIGTDATLNKTITLTKESSGEVRTTASSGGQKGVKPQNFALVPTYPLGVLAELYNFGASKYDDHNWRKGYEWSKSYSAAMRHLTAFWEGEDLDPESGLPHLASAAFHCFALMQWMVDHPEFDDRYVEPVSQVVGSGETEL